MRNARCIWQRAFPSKVCASRRPPVLTVHGDADEMSPYQDSLKLRDALTAALVPNEMVTISDGKRGRFRWSDTDPIRVQRKIESFLSKLGLTE